MNSPIPKKRSSQAVEPCTGSLPAVFATTMNSENKKRVKTMIDRIAPWPLEEKSKPKKKRIQSNIEKINERHDYLVDETFTTESDIPQIQPQISGEAKIQAPSHPADILSLTVYSES